MKYKSVYSLMLLTYLVCGSLGKELFQENIENGIKNHKNFKFQDANSYFKKALDIKPEDAVANELYGISLCYVNRLEDSLPYIQKAIKLNPNDWQPYQTLGITSKLLIRTKKNLLERQTLMNEAEKAMKKCFQLLESKGRTGALKEAVAKDDAFFYYHYGELLGWMDKKEEALNIHNAGVTKGFWKDPRQRPVLEYNPDLLALPWHFPEAFPYIRGLFQKHFESIKKELLSVLSQPKLWIIESEGLHDEASWWELNLFLFGKKQKKECAQVPLTCQVLEKITEASKFTMGGIKFSRMKPGTHVKSHCGGSNIKLRLHLGLIVPPGASISVGNQVQTWKEGEILVFDDSFEHEVWHRGTEERTVLIMDFLHPELFKTDVEKYLPGVTNGEKLRLAQDGVIFEKRTKRLKQKEDL